MKIINESNCFNKNNIFHLPEEVLQSLNACENHKIYIQHIPSSIAKIIDQSAGLVLYHNREAYKASPIFRMITSCSYWNTNERTVSRLLGTNCAVVDKKEDGIFLPHSLLLCKTISEYYLDKYLAVSPGKNSTKLSLIENLILS